jgi:hypothetical protein
MKQRSRSWWFSQLQQETLKRRTCKKKSIKKNKHYPLKEMKEKLSENQTIGFNCSMDSAWACAWASPTPASHLDLGSLLLGTKGAATDCVRAARRGGGLWFWSFCASDFGGQDKVKWNK